MIAALVLAGGASVRMGTPKAALRLGDRGHTVLSRGVTSLLEAGVPGWWSWRGRTPPRCARRGRVPIPVFPSSSTQAGRPASCPRCCEAWTPWTR
ncbi:MAG: NTP transferase domain-containing protein [Vicinamibacterales bacterium]